LKMAQPTITVSQSLLDSLLSLYLQSGSRQALASPHHPLLRAIVDELVRRTGHTQLVKVKSHMGMPMNAAADAQADIGAEGDPTTCEMVEAATMPILFRARACQPASHLSQFTLASMAQSRTEPTPLDPQPTPLPWTGIRSEVKKLVS